MVSAAFVTSPSGLSSMEATEAKVGNLLASRVHGGLALPRELSWFKGERERGLSGLVRMTLAFGGCFLRRNGLGPQQTAHSQGPADRDFHLYPHLSAAAGDWTRLQHLLPLTLLFPNPSPTPTSSDLSVLCRPSPWVAFLGSASSLQQAEDSSCEMTDPSWPGWVNLRL